RSYFGGQLDGESWANWRPLLFTILGEPLTPDELIRFEALTGRPAVPAKRPREFIGPGAANHAPLASWRPISPAVSIIAKLSPPASAAYCQSWLRQKNRLLAHS